MNAPILEVRDLSTAFRMHGWEHEVVRGIDIEVHPGEVLGLIGESGCGKTVTCLSILRLLPENTVTRAGHLRFLGKDLLTLPADEFRALRGNHMAMVFQDPAGALNPAKTIGWHMRNTFERAALKEGGGRKRADRWREEAVRVLSDVGIPDGGHVLDDYPHQLSGGMLQRVLIGIVLELRPNLIVADEPTTNLDNIVERQILLLFQALQKQLSAAFIFITHDMSIAATVSTRIAVMYAGTIVETGFTRDLIEDPRHPYTQGLIGTANALTERAERIQEIPGELPNWTELPSGCLFEPRCPRARPECHRPPAMVDLGGGRQVRCVLYDDA